MYIQWFPGHMTKALRMMQDNIKIIDIVGYVLDARAPFSCFNPAFEKLLNNRPCVFFLNKCDLADDYATELWLTYFKSKGIDSIKLVSTQSGVAPIVKKAFANTAKKQVDKMAAKGVFRPTRVMILGVPNSGKSTLINSLSGKKNAVVGNKAGVTKGKQWIRLEEGIELLDTPGTLWNKFENQKIAQNLLFIGSISDAVVDTIEAAAALLDKLKQRYSKCLISRYKLTEEEVALQGEILLSKIALKRGCLLKGEPDILRAATLVLDEFKNGKIGKITLEIPQDCI